MSIVARERIGQWASVTLLSFLAGSTWVLSSLPFTTNGAPPPIGEEVVAVITKAELIRTDRFGTPNERLLADRIEQRRDGSVDLYLPSLQHWGAGQANLRVRADRAQVSADQDTIALRGAVTMERSALRGEGAIKVASETLTYRVSEELLRSDGPIRITRGVSELYGTGIVINQKAGHFRVLSETRTVLTPSASGRSSEGTP